MTADWGDAGSCTKSKMFNLGLEEEQKLILEGHTVVFGSSTTMGRYHADSDSFTWVKPIILIFLLLRVMTLND